MSPLAIELLAFMLVLVLSPAMVAAGTFARRGDRKALRRLYFIVPGESIAFALLLLWAVVMEINHPTNMLIGGSIAFGCVGALASLLLHILDTLYD